LEVILAEQENIKREVRTLHEMMEDRKLERERQRKPLISFTNILMAHAHDLEEPRGGFDMAEEEYRETSDDDGDDDARSMSTVVPHELEHVEEDI
jgi:hypothetical protein